MIFGVEKTLNPSENIKNQNAELKTFIPKYIDDFTKTRLGTQYHYLKLENLMKGRENANIIDLKMGTSTVTCNIKGHPERMQKRL